MRTLSMTFILAALLSGCSHQTPDPGTPQENTDAGLPPEEPLPSGPPVETGPPNVPEFQPAFPGQTRVPAIKTKTDFQVTEIASGFKNPWAIAFLPDQRMLVTEKTTGSLYIVTPQGAKSPAVAGLPPVDGRGQGGLLDVEVGPDYAQSGLIYWTYYEPRQGGNGLAVARAKLVDGARPRVEGVQVIFRMMPTLESTLHAGGRLVFTPDNKLFVTLGERSILEGRVQARDVKSHFGKVVRIHPDGSVPRDNPFVNTEGAKPEIWSLGHRNIQSAAFDAQGRLWIVEHGPRGGDEVNLVQAGRNYGWPIATYGIEYSGQAISGAATQRAGLEQPVYYWDPVIAPSGAQFYSGSAFPAWRGSLFIGGLREMRLVRLVMQGDRVTGEEHLLTDRRKRIRDVRQGPDGALYVITDEDSAELWRIAPRS